MIKKPKNTPFVVLFNSCKEALAIEYIIINRNKGVSVGGCVTYSNLTINAVKELFAGYIALSILMPVNRKKRPYSVITTSNHFQKLYKIYTIAMA
jgi:hypothetical protein